MKIPNETAVALLEAFGKEAYCTAKPIIEAWEAKKSEVIAAMTGHPIEKALCKVAINVAESLTKELNNICGCPDTAPAQPSIPAAK